MRLDAAAMSSERRTLCTAVLACGVAGYAAYELLRRWRRRREVGALRAKIEWKLEQRQKSIDIVCKQLAQTPVSAQRAREAGLSAVVG